MKAYITEEGQRYLLTEHALKRMAQRRVTQSQLGHILDNHDKPYHDGKGNICCESSLENGRRLRVVIADKSSPPRVITVIVL
jgi:hypothetical protein